MTLTSTRISEWIEPAKADEVLRSLKLFGLVGQGLTAGGTGRADLRAAGRDDHPGAGGAVWADRAAGAAGARTQLRIRRAG